MPIEKYQSVPISSYTTLAPGVCHGLKNLLHAHATWVCRGLSGSTASAEKINVIFYWYNYYSNKMFQKIIIY